MQFPLLSRSNPERYVKDVEVDTDEDETSACTPPTQPRAKEESLVAQVSRKRRWGGAEKSQQREYAALKRKRPLAELCSRPKQKTCRLVLPTKSAETGRAVEGRNSPSSGEDRSRSTAERSADLPVPKARTPSAKARRPSGQERRHAAPTIVPAADRCSAQVPFADSPSGLEPSAQRRKGKEPAEVTPSAQEIVSREPSGQEPSAEDPPEGAPPAEAQCEKEDDGEKGETRVPSAQPPSAQAPSAVDAFSAAAWVATDRADGANLSKTGSPTALDILAGRSAATAAEATQLNSQESPENSMATIILNSEDEEEESTSAEQGEKLVQGTPTGVLCGQVVPLLQYLDRKMVKYADPRNPGSYVELVRKRTRTKKVVSKTRDEKFEETRKEFAKEQSMLADELDSEQTRNRILLEELMR
ncbi:hypothetical protein AXG93_841s1020 [Marchantia polymorpha subsp. ruderalis]|uniref:Uncharacterized protein n=1 Tax=Marchantia polymorpha subsp. ruderalis TaxID=1480154 RepID=A0A176WDY6_MARPO|nr:hypothetical protein AXG93_841s1020 [Marchantia polymorpha subsp. ruderalis]